jgi:hypothetical protein
MEGIAGKGTRLFNAVCELDLEGIVANRMSDPYTPETKWFKIPEHPNGPRRPHPQAPTALPSLIRVIGTFCGPRQESGGKIFHFREGSRL